MTKRPSISPKVMVSVAIKQAEHGEIPCPLCGTGIASFEARVLEHMTPHELGGSSEEENLRWLHKECAALKTNGSKATSADGDLHRIAKAKRLERARQAHEDAVLGKHEPKPIKLKPRIPSRPFPKRGKQNADA